MTDTATRPAPITLAQAKDLMAQIVAEKEPGFCYRRRMDGMGCFYAPLPELVALGDTEDGRNGGQQAIEMIDERGGEDATRLTTACLVGEILSRHGFVEHKQAVKPVDYLAGVYPWMFEGRVVVTFLRIAQDRQDSGEPWEEAQRAALEYAYPYLDAVSVSSD